MRSLKSFRAFLSHLWLCDSLSIWNGTILVVTLVIAHQFAQTGPSEDDESPKSEAKKKESQPLESTKPKLTDFPEKAKVSTKDLCDEYSKKLLVELSPEVVPPEANHSVVDVTEVFRSDGSGTEDVNAQDVIALTAAIAKANQDETSMKYICTKKVEAVWKRCRGDAPGPKEKNIMHAIKCSDTNKDGRIQPDEMKRIAGAFMAHTGDDADAPEKPEELFQMLDENMDGSIGFDEVVTAFKTMWLLKKDGVKLSELLESRLSRRETGVQLLTKKGITEDVQE